MTITSRSTSVLLARVAGATLISIAFILIATKTPFAPRAAAQNAAGYRVDSRADNGLYITTFTTPLGVIKVNLPDDMAAGDTISGTVTAESTGQNDAERAQNLAELKRHVLVVEGLQSLVGAEKFSWSIPRPLNMNSKNISLLQRGQTAATTTIPISATPPPSPSRFTIPTGGQQGRLIQIKGPGNGIFSSQDYVKVGGTVLPPLAESPRSLIVQNASDSVGPTSIDVHENGVGMQCPFRNIGINLAAPRLNLLRGETTTLHVVVVGLGGVAGDQSLDLENTSPSVIRMSGGDRQHLNIRASEVRPDGTYSMDRTLTGIMAGSFGVTATVTWAEVCKPLILVVGPVTRPTPTATPTGGQGSARDKLEQGRNPLAHFKFYAALAPLTEALKSYKSGGDMNGIGVTSDALGDLYLEEGQYEVALGYFQSARQAFVANKEMLNASLMISKIGETYLLLDNIAEAKAVFAQFGSQAGPPFPTDMVRHKTFFAYSRNKLGEGRADYLLGQHKAAEADFQELLAAASLPTARDQEATRFRVAAATNLGDVLFRKGDLAAARIRYNEAIQLARRDRRIDLEWAAKAGLGKTLWALSQRALTTQLPTRLRTPGDLRAAHASGQTQESAAALQADSQNAYRDALADIETVVEGSIRGHEARTTFLSTTRQVFEEAAALNAEMSLAAKRNNTTASAGSSLRFTAEGFRIAEQGRARSLLDVLADGHAVISAGVPPDLIKRRGENLANQQLIGVQLTGVSIAGETPKQTFTELEAELERLAGEFESLENQIKAASPRLNSLVHTRSLELDEVQQRVLDDETALLEYSLGEQSSYLWVITRQNAAVFKLPAGSTIDQLAMDLRAQLIPARLQRRNVGIDVPTTDQQRGLGLSTAGPATDTAAFSRASHALYKVALAPAASMIGNRRLVIVADGALNFIPFEALVTTDRGGDYSSLDYLIKTNRVSYAPSASVTAAVRDQKRAVGRNILLVADPVFSANDPRLPTLPTGSAATRVEVTRGLGLASAVKDVTGQAIEPSGPLTLPRLAGTRIEAEQIGRLAKAAGAQADLWLDLGANEDDLKHRDLQSYRALHIATHGVLDAMRPQFSGLVLSLVGNKSDDDGFLRTSEVFNLRLGAPLVMLSACETGLGKVKRGEGVIGLSRAFMYAGATTVGVTLWSVADKPTAELMTDFYQRLLGPNPSPSAAIREAQLAMISGKKYSAPFYWAPFVFVGEWK